MGSCDRRLAIPDDGVLDTITANGYYYATAVPRQRTGTAIRAFAVDQNDVIWYDATGAAPKPPFTETLALKRLQVLPKTVPRAAPACIGGRVDLDFVN